MSNEQQFPRCAYLSPGLSMLWVMYEKPFLMSKWLDFGRSIFLNICLALIHTHYLSCYTNCATSCFVFFIGWSGKELFGIFIFTNKTRKTRVSRFKLSKCDWRQGREKCCVLKNEENQIVFCVSALCSITSSSILRHPNRWRSKRFHRGRSGVDTLLYCKARKTYTVL